MAQVKVRKTGNGLAIKGPVGFNGKAPTGIQSNVAPVSVTFTTGNPGIVLDTEVTIADGAAPTVSELLAFIVKLNAQVAALSLQLQTLGLQAEAE